MIFLNSDIGEGPVCDPTPFNPIVYWSEKAGCVTLP